MKKLFIIFLLIPFFGQGQTAGINGVITYYYNQYQGDKPDIGSKVYVGKADNPKSLSAYASIDSFFRIKDLTYLQQAFQADMLKNQKLANKYKGKKKQIEEYEKYQKLADDDKKKFDFYTKELLRYRVESATMMGMSVAASQDLTRFKEAAYKTATVDGAGNYSIKVDPGKYLVIIVSNGRTSLSTFLEYSGKIFMKKIDVKENDTESVSHNFTL